MSGLKRKLSFMFGSTLERNILTLLNSNLTGYIDEEVCETVALVLENKSSKYSRQEAFDCILKQTGNITSWPLALRTIMVFHKLTHIQGDLLTDILTNNRIEALAKFKVPNAPLKSYVHSAMVSHYYKYLQKLSYNYEDLSICFYTNTDFPKRLKENNLSVMHFLSKVQNMLKYLIEILPLCEASLNQFGATDLVSQVTYFCLTDCYYYYAYTSHTISIMIDGIFNLQEQDALFLFELYCENIQVTKQLSLLFQLRNHLKHFSLKIPTFFEVDEDLNKRVETYISSLKRGETKPLEKRPLKGKPTAALEIEVEENPLPVHNLAPSLQDLSNVLIQITTPNFKSIQKKELFKPPVLTKKDSGADVGSEARVLSPNGPDRGGIKLPEVQKPGSIKGGHEFNPFMAKENYLRMNSTGSKVYNPFIPISKDTTAGSPNEPVTADEVSAQEQVSS